MASRSNLSGSIANSGMGRSTGKKSNSKGAPPRSDPAGFPPPKNAAEYYAQSVARDALVNCPDAVLDWDAQVLLFDTLPPYRRAIYEDGFRGSKLPPVEKEVSVKEMGGDNPEGNQVQLSTKVSLNKITLLSQHLSEEQKAVVNEMGFGGLLLLPKSVLKHDICTAMAEIFDPVNSEFNLYGIGSRLSFSYVDVNRVLGIPMTGELPPLSGGDADRVSELEDLFKVNIVKKSAVHLNALETRFLGCASHGDGFKALFTLYVTGFLLCPGNVHGVDMSFFHSVADVDLIGQFNWSLLVCNNIVRGIEIFNGADPSCKSKYFPGCVYVLQILFLQHVQRMNKFKPVPMALPFCQHWSTETATKKVKELERCGGKNYRFCRFWKLECEEEEGDAEMVDVKKAPRKGIREELFATPSSAKNKRCGFDKCSGEEWVRRRELDELRGYVDSLAGSITGKGKAFVDIAAGETRSLFGSPTGSSVDRDVEMGIESPSPVVKSCAKKPQSPHSGLMKPPSIHVKGKKAKREHVIDLSSGCLTPLKVSVSPYKIQMGDHHGWSSYSISLNKDDKLLLKYLSDPSPDDSDMVISFPRFNLNRLHMRQLLNPAKYVSADVIDLVGEMLVEETKSRDPTCKIWYMPTYFSSVLVSDLHTPEDNVRVYYGSKRFNGDVKDVERIFIPVNVGDKHWVLYVVDFVEKVVHFCDSTLPSENPRRSFLKQYYCVMEKVEEWLGLIDKDHILPVIHTDPPNYPKWLPKQNGTLDCALHVCNMMRFPGLVINWGYKESSKRRFDLAKMLFRSEHNSLRYYIEPVED